MSQLNCSGISGASDAFTVSQDGKRAFLFQRMTGTIVRKNLETGEQTSLPWKGKVYGSPRYIVYCLFQWKRLEDGLGPDRLGMLVFDMKSKQFRFVCFIVTSENNLQPLRDFPLECSKINHQRLAYSSHKHAGKIEIIFYERYNHGVAHERLNFSYNAIDLSNLDLMTPKSGTLPPGGYFELPFVAEMKLHFISIERDGHKIASQPISFLNSSMIRWTIDSLRPTLDGNVFPKRRALWCNAWEQGVPFFATAQRSQTLSRTVLNLWVIDLRNKQWQKIPSELQIPFTSENFAIRATANNTVVLHFDVTFKAAFFYKFDVAETLQNLRQYAMDKEQYERLEAPQTTANFTEVACPICLETFTDPRTLFCGHSLCFGCLVRMREVGATGSMDVKCPTCRRITKIPGEGLPTNYGLQDAIALMVKAQKIRESGFKCTDCKDPGVLEDFYVCLHCIDQLPTKIPETVNMVCRKCASKNHEGHEIREFGFFQNYFSSLKSLKDDCNLEIQKTAEEISQQLQQVIQTFVTDRLVKTAKQTVQTFCEEKTYRSDEELTQHRREVTDTLTGISERLFRDSSNVLTKMLEKAILDDDNHSDDLNQIPPLTDEEIMERLLKI